MWQKVRKVPALGTVLLLLTVVASVQKIDLGILALSEPQNLILAVTDPSSDELFSPKNTQIKLKSAVESPSVRSLAKKAENEAKKKKSQPKKPQIAFQTSYKPKTNPAPGDIESLVRKYAQEYGANAEIMLIIARCESGFKADAVSPSGAYKGLFQFVTSTWQSNRRAMGLSDDPLLMLNAEEAIKTAAFKMGRDGYGAWPACSQKAFLAIASN